ncbi:hypothetical protein OVA10_09870 [Lelliottia sp. SL45]|uniref:hypothetical protein n=1 Tax=Lelliottia TaxID=1330545 RepID=UPI000931435A|nr:MULTISPECIES: hypothetical protein [Lelliottia]MCY1698356.1 hypothetical protein [Lelliottia sp. SL45]QXA22063.1 hypothetical protein I6L74_01045 [Lelliottia amnigena]USR61448.1 hypothetical protein NFJ01_03405 [Lelliottia amnigena]
MTQIKRSGKKLTDFQIVLLKKLHLLTPLYITKGLFRTCPSKVSKAYLGMVGRGYVIEVDGGFCITSEGLKVVCL